MLIMLMNDVDEMTEQESGTYNESNSMVGAVQMKANLQKAISVHLHYRKLKCC